MWARVVTDVTDRTFQYGCLAAILIAFPSSAMSLDKKKKMHQNINLLAVAPVMNMCNLVQEVCLLWMVSIMLVGRLAAV